MSLTAYTNWVFVVGVLAGLALVLIARGIVDQVFIIRYRRSHRRRPIGSPDTRLKK